MIRVRIIPDNDLRYFTEKKFGSGAFSVSFSGKRSARDLLESVGIPHVEIGGISLLRNGRREDIGDDSLIDSECSLRVRSAAETSDLSGTGDISLLCFVLDVHLGRLSSNLRMLGFRTDYSNNRNDEELESTVSGIGPPYKGILLSCDRGLLKRRGVETGMLIRSREPVAQAAEVLARFRLARLIRPLTLCISCGAPLERAGAVSDLGSAERLRIPPAVRSSGTVYTRCSLCGRLYWPGTHVDEMRKKIGLIVSLADFRA